MGSLDKPEGSVVKRKIKLVDVTGQNASAIETAYNNNYGQIGWRIVQIISLGSKVYVLAEREE